MKKTFYPLLLPLVVLTTLFCTMISVSYAENEMPYIPYLQNNICPFECCQFGEWVARTPLSAFEKEGADNNIIFTINSGEVFRAISGNVHVTKAGIITINEPNNVFTKGDKVYILSYRGEGMYDLWYKGKMIDLNLDDMEKIWSTNTLDQMPEFEWWVLIKNKEGNQGWLKLRNISKRGFRIKENIQGMDSCS